jgi:hypothetical protein
MGSLYIWISAVVAIIVWEFLKSEWIKDKLWYFFFFAFTLSYSPILIGCSLLTILFIIFNQVLAASISGGLVLLGLIFKITNGFHFNKNSI